MSHNKSHCSREYRCLRCGKLLAKDSPENAFEIKCLRCGMINAIFRGIQEQVIITDIDGRILYVNGLIEQITGYSAQEIEGKTPAIWGGQMSKEFYVEMWRILLVERRAVVARVTNRHKSGKLYDAFLRISPIFNTVGEPIFFVGTERIADPELIAQLKLGDMPRAE